MILAVAKTENEAGEEGNGAGKKLRIIIVDDNQNITKLFSRMIGLIGHDTRVCHDGAAALKLAVEYEPDLALIDIGLPDMTGYEAAQALKKLAKDQGLKMKLVAVTGYGQYDDFRRSAEAGFDKHLVKPIELGALEKLLADLAAG